ncbi:EAL and HDOD domain-containing protein [Marinobacterium arenosum]|uniref:EAL and HDOD domain-containing protein n=1 Tax=Marinobacterium arenosum TaxID=2862496 RepID=UPI001C98D775|nr:HDOD domain-containing protein [Marinobacterium arenosum]MBY4677493.1 HDOD domain-containing protein [Marinobacterium arenosum]
MNATAAAHGVEHSYLIARQPIVNGNLKLIGYELLYRPGCCHQPQPVSGDMATAQVLSTSLSETDLTELVGDCTAFINMTREAILNIDLLSLPSDRVVFEILENIEIDPILLNKVKALIAKGYRFALDDFSLQGIHNDHIELADVVKVDVMGLSRQEIAEHVRVLKRQQVKLIAEKVETWEDFEYCKSLGFDLFQGYFFAKPQLVSGKSIRHHRSTTYRLISRLNDPNVDFDELERLIGQDPALSYKLFRYVNSALIARNRKFSNLGQVLVLLGLDRLRAVATLFAMCQMEAKPAALARTLLQRAQLCRLQAQARGVKNPEDYFTVGMFSMIDAFMDKPLDEALRLLPLPDEYSESILQHAGPMGDVLKCVMRLEQQTCSDCERCIFEDDRQLLLFNDAARWATDTIRILHDSVG